MTERVVFSCVMDQKPRYLSQARLFVQTLIAFGGCSGPDIVIHGVGEPDERSSAFFNSLGVPVVRVEPTDSRHPHSNKLAQLGSSALESADFVVLCDCDLAFCADIRDVIGRSSVRAKIVDYANISLEQWASIYSAAGLPLPTHLATSTYDEKPTLANYCNGGLLVLPRSVYRELKGAWPRWNRYLLDRPSLLEPFTFFTDQVSFTLALSELGRDVEPLGLEYNFPTHLPYADGAASLVPKVLHYHDRVDASGFLTPTGIPAVDTMIQRVNDLIRSERRRSFDNFMFWEFRYAEHPQLGSGVGSRGATLEVKRHLVENQVAALQPSSVLDVGCGDLEVVKNLPVSVYTGLDLSPTSVRIAATKRPDWRFIAGDVLRVDVDPADLVLCFDVLLHQSREHYLELCRRLMDLARCHLIVSGYNQPPWLKSEIVFYHEPLSETLMRLIEGSGSIEIVGGYRDITIFRVTRQNPAAS